jgi:hypothetical protein
MDIVSIALAYALAASPPVPVFNDPYELPQPETETIFEPIHGFILILPGGPDIETVQAVEQAVFDTTSFPPEKKSLLAEN